MATTALERRWEVFQFHPPVLPPPPLRAELGAAAQGSTYNNNNNNLSDDGGGQQWRSFDSSVNAVSFGFVATAILISMFLVMAIFERFIRPNSPPSSTTPHHHHSAAGSRRGRSGNVVEAGGHHLAMGAFYANKFGFPSPKMTVYSKGVSVLMPGEQVPTFIAHPAPVPCPPDRVHFPPNIQLVTGQSSTGPPLGHGGS